MISIDKSYEDLYVINKSKFLSFVFPVTTEEEAKQILHSLRQKYSDATHVCSAYSLSCPKIEKADDDGEPSGTAGKPMLELIKKKKLENILLVVVRYFGGIKLGAGGLVRAYTNSGNLVLDKAQVVNIVAVDEYSVEIELGLGSKLLDAIRNLKGEVVSCVYTDKVTIGFVGNIQDELLAMFPSSKIEKIGSKKYARNN